MAQNIFFKDKRLYISSLGELITRIVFYSWYAVFSAATIVALVFTNVKPFFWAAVLATLFLLSRLIVVRKANRSISELSRRESINVADCATPSAYRIISASFRRAQITKEDPHLVLLFNLLKRRDVRNILTRLDVSYADFLAKLREKLDANKHDLNLNELRAEFESVAVSAFANGVKTFEKFVEPRNLFVAAVFSGKSAVTSLLNIFEINPSDIGEMVVFAKYAGGLSGMKKTPAFLGGLVFGQDPVRKRAVNRSWTSRPTSFLDKFSRDFTAQARREKIGFLIGHDREYENMLRAVSMPGKPNVILVGEPGSGITTLVAHLAYKMTKDEVPKVLFDKRLISLDIPKLLAGADADDLSERIRSLVAEVVMAGNVVLFIDNMHDLFRTSDGKSVNAIDMFLPLISNENIPVIGATYPREFKLIVEPRTDFLNQFEVVRVDEISEEEAVRFLAWRSILLEREFRVVITFKAIKKAVELGHKYFHDKMLPGSASDILKEAVIFAADKKTKSVSSDEVIKVAELKSKIPIKSAAGDEADKLLNLEELIHKKLVNQSSAVSAVSRALREYRSGLSRKGGPIASFLFVGPTGVGKTELSKILTEIQFGSKNLMQRFDMSEYQDRQSTFRLIGNPDGSRTGTLTDAVFSNPYSLILLDEFEKANADILNLFLQVFDDGRLTDSLGKTANFENTIIIATSNAHSNLIKQRIEEGVPIENISEEIKKKLTDYFKPELINRFSDVVAFRNLNMEEIKTIAGLLVNEVRGTIMSSHGIELMVDDAALRRIAELGYSPVFGARPLRQVISEKIRSVLADKILRKEISRGNAVNISFENGEFELLVTK